MSCVSTSAFLSRNGRTVVSRPSNCCDGVGQVLIGAGQAVGELGQVLVERHELLVVGVQRVDEQRQAAHHREEVAPALVERGQRPRQVVEGGVDLLALAGQTVGVGLDDVTERPLGLLLGGPEFGDDVGDGVAQLVPLGGHLGALLGDHRVVGQHRATLVRRLELEQPRRHQRRVEDHRLRIGGHLVLVGVVEGDLHLVAGRLDLVDRAHLHAHDLDPVAVVEGVGDREVGDDSVVGQLLVQLDAEEPQHQRRHDRERADDDRGARQLRQPEVAEIKDGAQFWLPPCAPLPPAPPVLPM